MRTKLKKVENLVLTVSTQECIVLDKQGNTPQRKERKIIAKYTEAKARANKVYDDKTYKKINIALRIEDDKEIIKSLEEAKKKGLNNREWLKEIYEGQK